MDPTPEMTEKEVLLVQTIWNRNISRGKSIFDYSIVFGASDEYFEPCVRISDYITKKLEDESVAKIKTDAKYSQGRVNYKLLQRKSNKTPRNINIDAKVSSEFILYRLKIEHLYDAALTKMYMLKDIDLEFTEEEFVGMLAYEELFGALNLIYKTYNGDTLLRIHILLHKYCDLVSNSVNTSNFVMINLLRLPDLRYDDFLDSGFFDIFHKSFFGIILCYVMLLRNSNYGEQIYFNLCEEDNLMHIFRHQERLFIWQFLTTLSRFIEVHSAEDLLVRLKDHINDILTDQNDDDLKGLEMFLSAVEG